MVARLQGTQHALPLRTQESGAAVSTQSTVTTLRPEDGWHSIENGS